LLFLHVATPLALAFHSTIMLWMFAGSRAFGAAAFALSFICTGTRGEGNAQQFCPSLLKGAMKRIIFLVWLQAFFQASAQMPTRGIYSDVTLPNLKRTVKQEVQAVFLAK
jgi:hypothetical protein